MSKCLGCGVELQTQFKDQLGYIPPSADAEGKMYCERCFKIRNHNYDYSLENYETLMDANKTKQLHHEYYQKLEVIKNHNSLVLLLIDAMDIHNGFMPHIDTIIKNNPLWVLVNKSDLYPKALKLKPIEDIISKEAQKYHLDLGNILFISSSKLSNVDLVMKRIKESINKKGFNKTHVFVIGSTSVGKSTFINQIIDHYALDKDTNKLLTTSFFSNTTKQNIYIEIGENMKKEKCFIVDTPGYLNPLNIKSYLSLNALKCLEFKGQAKPKTFQLNSNQAFLLDKIASLDIKTEKMSVSFYVSNELYIHRTKLENKERAFLSIGNFDTIKFNENELNVINDQTSYEYHIDSEANIWLSGIGFIHLVGTGEVIVYAPKRMKVDIDYEV